MKPVLAHDIYICHLNYWIYNVYITLGIIASFSFYTQLDFQLDFSSFVCIQLDVHTIGFQLNFQVRIGAQLYVQNIFLIDRIFKGFSNSSFCCTNTESNQIYFINHLLVSLNHFNHFKENFGGNRTIVNTLKILFVETNLMSISKEIKN